MNGKEKHNEYNKNWHQANKDKINEKRRLRYKKNKDKGIEYNKNWKEKNPNYKKKYDDKNKKEILKKNKNYYEKNKDKILKKRKIYYQKNKDKVNKRNDVRRIDDKLFKLKGNIRCLIYQSLKRNGFSKRSKTYEILGCTFEEFKLYLESKFEPWMNWDNRGSVNGKPPTGENQCWDIDHIKPSSIATTEEEVIKLNHYTNLQPMCSYTNRWIKR